ncbi:SpoIIE family protein phosphatase [Synechococcus sp. CS-1328]|uniref:SpoIIE family protein phosphatase n=1 Tax=Synechococcus sp. CS-1328 TaxID=2847976 RepID=UPI00223A7666|nr:SpoIIE family protein phosphatase [Synechococcus sp. CS-1328]MCT0223961.1 SpoIIE family protein phosphatase [Synechococcus sp. CS-1328]
MPSSVPVDRLRAYLRHELCTPINAITGYAEMVQEDLQDLGSPLAEDCGRLREAGHQLLSLVHHGLLSEDPETASMPLQERLARLPDLMAVSLEAVRAEVNQLLAASEGLAVVADLVKVGQAAQTLDHLVHHLDVLAAGFSPASPASPPAGAGTPTQPSPSKGPRELEVPQKNATCLEESIAAHILVVDDTPSNLEVLERQLIRKGHQVTTCLNAEAALEQLRQQAFDLILLDLLMPSMNGDEFLRYLKSDPELRFIPVIMISALEDYGQMVKCIEIGAEDFLPKPFESTLLKARIGSSLERKRARDKEAIYTKQVEALSALLQQELDQGRLMQRNFLPAQLLEKPGWEFAAFFSPAKQLAGDFYDLFELPDGAVGIIIADVCDKGVGAALFMGLFRSLLRIFSGQTLLDGLPLHRSETTAPPPGPEPGGGAQSHLRPLDAIGLTNSYIAINHGETGMFATVFFGILELETGRMSYINAGHDPIYVLDSDARIKQVLDVTGPAVGMLAQTRFAVKEMHLDRGDLMLAYTDGITEARATSGEFFGNTRLQTLLSQGHASARRLTEAITEAVFAHTGEAEQFDDITLVAVKRL